MSEYLKSQLAGIIPHDEYKAKICINSGANGVRTNWLSVSNETLEKIKAVLLQSEKPPRAKFPRITTPARLGVIACNLEGIIAENIDNGFCTDRAFVIEIRVYNKGLSRNIISHYSCIVKNANRSFKSIVCETSTKRYEIGNKGYGHNHAELSLKQLGYELSPHFVHTVINSCDVYTYPLLNFMV